MDAVWPSRPPHDPIRRKSPDRPKNHASVDLATNLIQVSMGDAESLQTETVVGECRSITGGDRPDRHAGTLNTRKQTPPRNDLNTHTLEGVALPNLGIATTATS